MSSFWRIEHNSDLNLKRDSIPRKSSQESKKLSQANNPVESYRLVTTQSDRPKTKRSDFRPTTTNPTYINDDRDSNYDNMETQLAVADYAIAGSKRGSAEANRDVALGIYLLCTTTACYLS